MRFAPRFLWLFLGLELFACGDNSSTTTTVVRPELVGVSPQDFLGSVQCASGAEAGAGGADSGTDEAQTGTDEARSYVATLFDLSQTDGGVTEPGVQLPSSPATRCLDPVTFSFVVPGHRYRAEIDAYQLPPGKLVAAVAGAREQFSGGKRAIPDWQASCHGYPISPDPDAGVDYSKSPEAAGAPGVVSYAEVTQSPHDCDAGLLRLGN